MLLCKIYFKNNNLDVLYTNYYLLYRNHVFSTFIQLIGYLVMRKGLGPHADSWSSTIGKVIVSNTSGIKQVLYSTVIKIKIGFYGQSSITKFDHIALQSRDFPKLGDTANTSLTKLLVFQKFERCYQLPLCLISAFRVGRELTNHK